MYSKIRLHGFIFFSNTGHRSWLVKSMWPLCSLTLWSGLAYAESAFLPPILGFPSLLVHCPDAHQWASSSLSEWSRDSCLPGSSAPIPQSCSKPSKRFGSQCPDLAMLNWHSVCLCFHEDHAIQATASIFLAPPFASDLGPDLCIFSWVTLFLALKIWVWEMALW